MPERAGPGQGWAAPSRAAPRRTKQGPGQTWDRKRGRDRGQGWSGTLRPDTTSDTTAVKATSMVGAFQSAA
ncbi:hypothetical protein GCM10010428_08890 [Actinosynnema pretiosum subsp. pretiosum]